MSCSWPMFSGGVLSVITQSKHAWKDSYSFHWCKSFRIYLLVYLILNGRCSQQHKYRPYRVYDPSITHIPNIAHFVISEAPLTALISPTLRSIYQGISYGTVCRGSDDISNITHIFVIRGSRDIPNSRDELLRVCLMNSNIPAANPNFTRMTHLSSVTLGQYSINIVLASCHDPNITPCQSHSL